MQTVPKAKAQTLFGSTKPRIAPPVPARTGLKEFVKLAKSIGLDLWPWQQEAARYITATGPEGWLYPEVAVIAARQNGKSTIMVPLILSRILAGQRVVHTAQDRKLPMEIHDRVATIIDEHFHDMLPKRRGIKYGAGMEAVGLTNGGHYHIVAPSRSGARGLPNDLILIDEVLALDSNEFIAAANPSAISSGSPQIVYFSNAGDMRSVVLNELRERAETDPSLAYLEWSAPQDMAPDDVSGWLMANPAIGHNPALMRNLERRYQSYLLGGQIDIWEREHLCRMTLAKNQQTLVQLEEWERQEFVDTLQPVRPVLGIKMDVSGERASGVLAWQEGENVMVDVVADVIGTPIDVDRLGPDLQKLAVQHHAIEATFDPYTDADLARHLRNSKPMLGRDYANATEKFVRMVLSKQLRVRDCDGILSRDLMSTVRRNGASGTYLAIKASPEVTNTAAEAAIRATWRASEKRTVPRIG